MKSNWYNHCIKKAISCLDKKDKKGWVYWWCARNKFLWNLTDKEIECYRQYKLQHYKNIQKEIIATSNGKPKTITIQLKK